MSTDLSNGLPDSPAAIIQAYLTEDSGSPFTDPEDGQAWPLFVNSTPDEQATDDDNANVPDQLGTVYDSAGQVLHKTMKSGTLAQKFGIQIRTRSLDPNAAYAKASEAAFLLAKAKRALITIGSNQYVIDSIMPTSGVIPVGQDGRRRAMCTVNFTLMLIGA